MKTIIKELTIYDYEDLKKDNELCNDIYQEFWLDDPNNINPYSDENLDSFKEFANTLYMTFDYSLSYAEYPDRSCYIKLKPDPYYDLSNKDYKELLKDYEGNGFFFCDDLKTFTLDLLNNKQYEVLCEWTSNNLASEIQNKMFDLWFQDNQYYFSKESFLNSVEANNYKFDKDGNLV
tara:strand:- start:94 stop:624 length:531 start_codon:yes stop_codon:yes gene_type:complete